MPVTNEDPPDGHSSGPLGQLLRLQSEFSTRLAEETLKYLRNLQGALGPAVPGTVVMPDAEALVAASGAPGGTVRLSLELQNLQRVHCMVSPRLTPLVSGDGVTWFCETEPSSPSLLMAPEDVQELRFDVSVPAGLPVGEYKGAILLVGFRDGAVPVSVQVKKPSRPRKKAAK